MLQWFQEPFFYIKKKNTSSHFLKGDIQPANNTQTIHVHTTTNRNTKLKQPSPHPQKITRKHTMHCTSMYRVFCFALFVLCCRFLCSCFVLVFLDHPLFCFMFIVYVFVSVFVVLLFLFVVDCRCCVIVC